MMGFNLEEDGCVIEFANGLAVSVRWSAFHYCEARAKMRNVASTAERLRKAVSSMTAEVAVMFKGAVVSDVYGYLTPYDVVTLMAIVRDYSLPSKVALGPYDMCTFPLLTKQIKEEVTAW